MSDVSKKQTLTEIISEARAQNQELIESFGELTPELEAAIELNEKNLQSKVDNYYFRIQDLVNQLEIFKNIKKQADQGRNMIQRSIDRLKWNMEMGLKVMELKQVLGNYSKFTLTKTKQKVIITDPEKIPLNLTRAKTEISPDLEAIYDYLSKGGTLEGAYLEDNYYLRATGNNIKTVKDVEATPEIESPCD